MKKSLILVCALIATISTSIFAEIQGTFNYQFAKTSKLATGKWVKIYIDKSGIYEMSYDELRALGFEDPYKVSVHGMGGTQQPANFYDNNARRQYEDDLTSVATLHRNNKIYFYGEANEKIVPSYVSWSTVFFFKRESLNIYTTKSCYLLTDSQPVATIPDRYIPASVSTDESNFTTLDYGHGFCWHELELMNGLSDIGGQQHWGEPLSGSWPDPESYSYDFSVDMPYHYFKINDVNPSLNLNKAPATMYLPCFVTNNTQVASLNVLFPNNQTKSWVLSNRPNFYYEFLHDNISTPEGGHVDFQISSSGSLSSYSAYIDNWVLTYPKSLANAGNDPNFRAEVLGMPLKLNKMFRIKVPDNSIVWDITKRDGVKNVPVENGYAIAYDTSYRSFMVFDPDRKQLSPLSHTEEVKNQNLHALAGSNAELLIVTTEMFRSYAEQVADLHRKYDGIEVIVVTNRELYDEFSNCNNDPMAIRAFAKMLYQKGGKVLKNILLFGPLHDNLRRAEANQINTDDYIIAVQELGQDVQSRAAGPHLDWYGYMSDYTSTLAQACSAEVGVGVLPVSTIEEARLALNKISNHLTTDDFSWIVNDAVVCAHNGDTHVHERQAEQTGNLLRQCAQNVAGSRISVPYIYHDAVGTDQARKAYISAVNDGKLLNVFYGHGGSDGLGYGRANQLLRFSDLMKVKNPTPAFAFYATCSTSTIDKGEFSFGDVGVLRAPHGYVGAVTSTRSVMSNSNEELCRAFINGMFFDRKGNARVVAPTAGEVYAQAKNEASSESELSYIYVGDPALKIPVPLAGINLAISSTAVRCGETVTLTGQVLDTDGNLNSEYNGKVSVKICRPAQEVIYNLTPGGNATEPAKFLFDSDRISAYHADVKDGKFTVKLVLPNEVKAFMSAEDKVNTLPVYVGAYDPTLREAASGYIEMALATADSQPSDDAEFDTSAPTLSLVYDQASGVMTLDASDDTGFYPGVGGGSSIQLTVDGEAVTKSESMQQRSVLNYNALLSMNRLEEGEHTAKAVISDLAGNIAEKSISFKVVPFSPITLSSNEELVVDSILFNISELPIDGLEVALVDHDGNLAAIYSVDNKNMRCDLTGLPAGIYRASVRHASAAGAKVYSNIVQFTVID